MTTTPVLKKYAASLRGIGPGGIPVAAPDGIRLHGATLAVHYSLTLEQYADQLHPTLGPTSLWGYHPDTPVLGGRQPNRHLGGIIVAWKDLPVQLTVTNALPPPTCCRSTSVPISPTPRQGSAAVDTMRPRRTSTAASCRGSVTATR